MKSWNIDFCDLYFREHRDVFIAALVRCAESLGKVIPGEKTPFNEFYYDIVREWLNDFELKFVHILRNPFDATASYKHFGQATFRRGKSNGRTSDISAYCRNWVRSAYIGLTRARYDSERYYLLKYEDLAADPINTTRDLCEFLGVDFEEERMLSLSDFSGHRDNTSFSQDRGRKHAEYSVIRKPKNRKNYLTDSELRVVSAICGELAEALEYVDDDFRSSPPERTHRWRNQEKAAASRWGQYSVKVELPARSYL